MLPRLYVSITNDWKYGGIKGSVEENWTHVSDRACMGCARLYGRKTIWNYLNVPRISLSFIERSVLLQSNFTDRSMCVYFNECIDFKYFTIDCACMGLANKRWKEEKKQVKFIQFNHDNPLQSNAIYTVTKYRILILR